jgi:hypothetical protein
VTQRLGNGSAPVSLAHGEEVGEAAGSGEDGGAAPLPAGKEVARRQGRSELRTGAVGDRAFYTSNDHGAA